ncbi:hypothetical protein B0H14DRAFT_2831934 [Mycena olivaceomarginata]|nr:hypothetical protein B0H14DRAFT_2831934 [Mycena olivaceomarginata]
MTSRYRWKLQVRDALGAGKGNALADFLFVQFADVASHVLEEINTNKCASAPLSEKREFSSTHDVPRDKRTYKYSEREDPCSDEEKDDWQGEDVNLRHQYVAPVAESGETLFYMATENGERKERDESRAAEQGQDPGISMYITPMVSAGPGQISPSTAIPPHESAGASNCTIMSKFGLEGPNDDLTTPAESKASFLVQRPGNSVALLADTVNSDEVKYPPNNMQNASHRVGDQSPGGSITSQKRYKNDVGMDKGDPNKVQDESRGEEKAQNHLFIAPRAFATPVDVADERHSRMPHQTRTLNCLPENSKISTILQRDYKDANDSIITLKYGPDGENDDLTAPAESEDDFPAKRLVNSLTLLGDTENSERQLPSMVVNELIGSSESNSVCALLRARSTVAGEGKNYTDNRQNPPYDLGGISPGGAATATASNAGGEPSPREDSIWRNVLVIYVSTFAVGFAAHYLSKWALSTRNRGVADKYANGGVAFYAAPAKFNNSEELEEMLGTDYMGNKSRPLIHITNRSEAFPFHPSSTTLTNELGPSITIPDAFGDGRTSNILKDGVKPKDGARFKPWMRKNKDGVKEAVIMGAAECAKFLVEMGEPAGRCLHHVLWTWLTL